MKIIVNTWRGCGYLPFVGSHPGTLHLIALLVLGAVGGGWIGVLVMGAFCLPIYLYGAYDRAVLSDRLRNREGVCGTF